MIEVIAIDGREAEAGLLRLASDFARLRLFLPKQAKKLNVTCEVAGMEAARPISREALMAKAGLFKSSQFHYHYRVSVAHGFETALMQFMHEFVHISQVIHGRYQLSQKRVKRDGEKQQLYQARWLGKKLGFVDDIEWQERPWEAEAAQVSAQLTQEFMAMVYGTQSEFEAQKGKKQLPLHHVSFALPNMTSMPDATMPDATMPELAMPEASFPEASFNDPQPTMSPDSMMASDMQVPPIEAYPDENFGPPGIDPFMPEAMAQDPMIQDAQDGAAPPLHTGSVQTGAVQTGPLKRYVQGIDKPRHLDSERLQAKRQEMAERGLLEK